LWSRWPDANVGIRTGAVSGIVAVDIDPRNGGRESILDVAQKYGKLDASAWTYTGGGGRHALYRHPGGRLKSTTIADGIDVKADGGYIVAPPSRHASGNQYGWGVPLNGTRSSDLSPLPEWIAELLQERVAMGDIDATPPVSEVIPQRKIVALPDRAERTRGRKNQARKQDGSSSSYATWDELWHEWGLRLQADPTGHRNSQGNWDARAACHNGKGKTGQFYDPAANRGHCNAGCDEATVLRSRGLPDRPLLAEAKPTGRRRKSKSAQGGPDYGQIGRASLTPATWFAERYPLLVDECGAPILEETNKHGITSVRDIGEDFMAATFSSEGSPDTPTVFIAPEQKFYTYSPDQGIYLLQREPQLLARFSRLLLRCARECRSDACDTRSLEFRFRGSAKLLGVLRKARGVLEAPDDFFSADLTEFLPVANGVLRLRDKALLPFSSSYRRRSKLAVSFDPSANCPTFLETLMTPALEADDLDLLQRWCGLALIGENTAQKVMILIGTPGGGKGTFIRVLTGIIGQRNLESLRPRLLGERFELSRFLGKTLLYGADVRENFLNQGGASVLKALTGNDPMTVEFKNSNESPFISGRFNVIATCNSRLTVHLEGDVEAWRRRLVIVHYHKSKPASVIADLDKRILSSEAPGVLNWMLAGLDKLRADGWQLRVTSTQQSLVDNLLLESDGHALFVREELEKQWDSELTISDCFDAYIQYCNERSWSALPRNRFGHGIGDIVARQHGLAMRHDIRGASGKAQRGWRGLGLRVKGP
jgi:P4 family phage/plasmid primase-like protien